VRGAKQSSLFLASKAGVAVTVFLIATFLPAASRSGAHLDPNFFYVSFPRHVYTQSVRFVSQVDFPNFPVDSFSRDGRNLDYSAVLRDGRSLVVRRNPDSYDDVALLAVDYFDFSAGGPVSDGGKPRFALTNIGWVTAGNSATDLGVTNLYDVVHNRLVLEEQINFLVPPGGGANFDPTTRTLTVKTCNPDISDHRCSGSKLIVVTFDWTGSSFRERSARTVIVANPKGTTW
jgi:hypothetical protein